MKFFLLLHIENHCGQNVEIFKLNGYLAFAYPAEVIQDLKRHKFVFCANFALFFQL
jgi:hypothetical protein